MTDEPIMVDGPQHDEAAGSGAHALAGYDYQVDVSSWLALDLLLANKLARVMELEPASEEDIEADLGETEPGRLATAVPTDGYKLVVQAKLRGGDAWTVAGINKLLQHGSNTRPSAARRLADPTVRYLLVTSAALNGLTRGLAVGRAGNWPRPSEMPKSTAGILPAHSRGRVAIIGRLDEDRVVGEIKRLLVERFGVPNARWTDCLKVLREEARLRVRRVGGGRWEREQLAEIIRNHDGYLAASPELDAYVHPRNWADLRRAMEAPRHAAVIIGQSGTGKTLATHMLYEELRREIPGLALRPIRLGPQELADDRTPSPVLYDIEDPWGRYDFDSRSRPWNDQLSGFLARATADRRIVVTSRRDVAQSSSALKSVEPWLVPLEVEHYGPRERQRLYRSRIPTLPRDVQLLASEAERRVLEQLASPLEIEKYFDAMRTMGRPEPNNGYGFVGNAIERAHEGAIEMTVIQQIEERRDVAAAAVLWAMLHVSDKLSIATLRGLEPELADRLPAFERGVTPLVDFFIAARNLRGGEGDATYYHSRVEAGIIAALSRSAVPAVRALRALIDVLTDPESADPDWGAGAAARIIEAASRVEALILVPRAPATRVIDAWIDRCMTDPAMKLDKHLRLAAAAGSAASLCAELARFVRHEPDRSFGGFMHWGVPKRSEDWYERMRANPNVQMGAARFVREVLPHDHFFYGRELVPALERIAGDLTPAYLEAAAGMVSYGQNSAIETVAEGAVRDLDRFEAIVNAAVAASTETPEQQQSEKVDRLAYLNTVWSGDYAQHMADRDDGYCAHELLETYAARIRAAKGWEVLRQHRHAEALLYFWVRSLMQDARDGAAPAADELEAAFSAAYGTSQEERIWYVLSQHWDGRYADRLRTRLLDGAASSDVRLAALACLVDTNSEALTGILDELSRKGQTERAVEIAIDLGYLLQRRTGDGEKHGAAAAATRDLLPHTYAEIADAARILFGGDARSLSPAALETLGAIKATRPDVRRLRISRHAELGNRVLPDIRATLAEAEICWESARDCREAIEAAVALSAAPVVEHALDHMFADVVATALKSVGAPMAAPLPASLLALAKAEGSPVRTALVALLADKLHPDHLPALLGLAGDEWSPSDRHYGEDDDFPIAQKAIATLGALDAVPDDALERLDAIAIATTDPDVRTAIFILMAKRGGLAFQERLLERCNAPGRAALRRSAAVALLRASEHLDPAIFEVIDADIVSRKIPGVAVPLAMLLAYAGPEPQASEIAGAIAAKAGRRVIVLAMIYAARFRRPELAERLESLLPSGHPAIAWLRADRAERADDSLVADLGAADVCAAVLRWVNPPVLSK